ncbi:MAG: radical SAM protein [Ferruginibacter sp.]
MTIQSLYQTFNRYRTLQTDKISSLPIVILMPHSSCNCRCSMCDIWKGNHNLKQLNEADVAGLIKSLNKFGTKQVVMSGGEALLHPGFFALCSMLQEAGMHITLLSTGLTIKKHTEKILTHVNEIIVSLDGNEILHDSIRNIPGAYRKMREGIAELRLYRSTFPVSARCVIHRLNFRSWLSIIETAKRSGLDSISFLPADISSHAFNRNVLWSEPRQDEIVISKEELPELREIIEQIIYECRDDFRSRFILESPAKIRDIYNYYAAQHGLNDFPYKKCNAPWVSTVIEPDGAVRPCFFHDIIGNIHNNSLDEILNGETGISFRKQLDMDKNDTCKKCVCYLNLHPQVNPVKTN